MTLTRWVRKVLLLVTIPVPRRYFQGILTFTMYLRINTSPKIIIYDKAGDQQSVNVYTPDTIMTYNNSAYSRVVYLKYLGIPLLT